MGVLCFFAWAVDGQHLEYVEAWPIDCSSVSIVLTDTVFRLSLCGFEQKSQDVVCCMPWSVAAANVHFGIVVLRRGFGW